ncbi:hypothetical protein OAQ76_00280 [bacterium]|nr:hypothetical protein [bacterium]
MAVKKQHFAEGEIPILDEAFIYKRGEYWQFRMGCKKKIAKSEIKIVTLTVAVPKAKVVTKQPKQQMVEAKKNERANALKEVKRLCEEFGFTAGMLKGSLAEGRKPI